MKARLTDKFLQNLKPPIEGRLEVFDTLLPAFGVRIGPSGRPSFFVTYRVHGRQIRHTIGKYPVITLADARNAAMGALRLASGGMDPSLDKRRYEESQFKFVAEEFLLRYAKEHQKATTYKGTERHVNKHLIPAWGHLPVKDITRTHIRVLLDGIMDTGASTSANRVFATISKLFNWGVERGHMDTAPSIAMRAPAKEKTRDRVLSLDEIRAIWEACEQMSYPFGHWVQMMFATGGQRSGDVSSMNWTEIRASWWEISNPTKSDTPHRVPLSSLALDILDTAPKFEGPYVFSTRAGRVPISGYSKAKRELDRLTGIADWRFHDIRRTAATLFGEQLGLHPYVIERIQNRRSGTIRGVMKVYNRATYEDETSKAMSEWGNFLRALIQDNKLVKFSV